MSDRLRGTLQDALGTSTTLLAELGGGGMSRVFVARDLALGRDIVVKVLAPELAHGLSAERFALEIRTTAALQDPHIVPVLAAGTTADGLPYFTMPLVRGESLATRLARSGPIPAHEALVVLRDIAKALAGAHARGVVHRDIKPGNVLLAGGSDGAAPLTAMVTDFGIAKALSASATAQESAGLTVGGGTPGTPAYMSPEQAASDPETDHRTDLYSWGVVAYEVLSGRHPFAMHTTARALLTAHLAEHPAALSELVPGLSESVSEIVMRCLKKDPAHRPGSAGELLSALDIPPEATGSPVRRRVVENELMISEGIVGRLDRATLDPRIIGGKLQYFENDGAGDTMLFCVHGLGHDGSEFMPLLEITPHRAIAPTLHGFEAVRVQPRVPLAVGAHLGLLRELLRDSVERVRPRTVVLVGFSSGADMVLRMLAETSPAAIPGGPQVDACLALGPNVSLATCFVSRLFARLPDAGRSFDASAEGDTRELLAGLKCLGEDAADLDEWLNVMTYQIHSLRKFRGDVAALRRLASDIVSPFDENSPGYEDVFARWFRAASEHLGILRCVFDRSPAYLEAIPALKLRNLDDGVLGPHYRENALLLEATADHFALLEPARISHHLEAVLAPLHRTTALPLRHEGGTPGAGSNWPGSRQRQY